LAEARIQVTAQLIAMRAGLYALELAPIATTRAKGGMVLPCARIDPLPDTEAETHVAWLTSSPLLLPGSYPAFVRVGGEASLLLTIYKMAGPSAAPGGRAGRAALRAAGAETGAVAVARAWGRGSGDGLAFSTGAFTATGAGAAGGAGAGVSAASDGGTASVATS